MSQSYSFAIHEILQRANLIGQFLADPDDFVGRPHVVDLRAFLALGFEQPINAIKSDASIIADDAAPAVGIGKTGYNSGLPALHDFRRIRIEYAVVVSLAILREGFVNLRVGREAGGLQTGLYHAQAAVWKYGSLERLVGLQTDAHFVFLVRLSRPLRPHSC